MTGQCEAGVPGAPLPEHRMGSAVRALAEDIGDAGRAEGEPRFLRFLRCGTCGWR